MNIRKVGAFLGVLSVFLYGHTLPGVTLNLFLGVFVLVLAAVTISLGKGALLLQINVVIALVVALSAGAVGVLLGRGPIFWKKLTSTAILGQIVATGLRSGNCIVHGFPFSLAFYYDVRKRSVSGAVFGGRQIRNTPVLLDGSETWANRQSATLSLPG